METSKPPVAEGMAPKALLRRPAAGGARPVAKAHPKGKAGARPVPRRALGAPGMRRPALRREAKSLKDGGVVSLEEVKLDELSKDLHLVLEEASYFKTACKAAGRVRSIEAVGSDRYMRLHLTGTTNEDMLKVATAQPSSEFKVHLCVKGCVEDETGDLVIHATKCRMIQDLSAEEDWVVNLEAVRVPPPGDELALLRAREVKDTPLEERGKEEASSSSSSERSKKKRKRSKKKKKKDKKAKKRKLEKDKKDKPEKIEDLRTPDGSTPMADSTKTQEALFSGTGLDPKDKVRRKVVRKARSYLGKRKKDKSSSSGTSSTTSGTEREVEDPEEMSLFQETAKCKALCERFPGVLTQASLVAMRESLLLEMGAEAEVSGPKASAVMYARQQLAKKATGPVLREVLNLCTSLDHIIREPCESGRRYHTASQVLGIDYGRHSLVHCSTPGMHRSGKSWHIKQERGPDSAEGDIRRGQAAPIGGPPGTEERRQGERQERKRKGREGRPEGQGQRRRQRERRSQGRRRKSRRRQEVRRSPADEVQEAEMSGLSLEDSGVEVVEDMRGEVSSGVVAPGEFKDSEKLGDWRFNAVPPNGSGRDPVFPISHSDQGAVGATDPKFLVEDEAPGSPQASGEKDCESEVEGLVSLRSLGSRVLQGFLEVLPLRSKTMEVGHSGSLFPLPTSRDQLKLFFPGMQEEGVSWLVGICVALNSLWGGDVFGSEKVTSCQQGCLEELAKDVERILTLTSTIRGFSWKEFFQTRSVDYQGEEVKIARRFSWENIRRALPAEIGRVPLREVCTLGAQFFVDNIDLFVKPRDQWGKITRPKVMVADSEWETVCTGLMECGLCCALSREEVFDTGSGPLLNGMFGVTKNEVVDGIEVYRLIMNLVPFNTISEPLSGDVATLPAWSSMSPFFLQPNERLLISSEDVRCFFYTMAVPGDWVKYLAFNKVIPDGSLPVHLKGRECYLASLVLPMGYLNSVSLAQHVHRNLVLASGRHLPEVSGVNCPQGELRKDLAFPDCEPRWRVYLDNYDLLERVEATQLVEMEGTEAPGVAALKAEYECWQVPRNLKKSVARSSLAELQGAQVDGIFGVAYPKEEKLLKYMVATLQLCEAGQATKRQLQVACGGLVYVSMFRRPILGCLNAVWQHIVSLPEAGSRCRPLPIQCRLELLRVLCLIPLARMDFRLAVDPKITCSDASESGGGLCSSVRLSSLGQMAASGALRGHQEELHNGDSVLCVDVFDGIGALRVALDLVGCRVLGYVSIEANEAASRVVEAHFPGNETIKDVKLVDQDVVHSLAGRYSQASMVILGAGPPCQGVSGLNYDRKGALRDERSGLFSHVSRIRRLFQANFPWCQVHCLMESVASMDEADCQVMSDDFGSAPWECDAGQLTWCSRPRLYWVTWELLAGDGADIRMETDTSRSSVVLTSNQPLEEVCKRGWLKVDELRPFPTFTTSRPRDRPGRKPAGILQCNDEELERWRQDAYRFPPYQYAQRNCLINRKNECRLPDAEEREYMLGFPVGYTRSCLPKNKRKEVLFNDTRLTLLGNSWSVPVVAWFLGQLLAPLGFIHAHSPQYIMDKLNPTNLRLLQAKLFRLPLNPLQQVPASHDQGTLADSLCSLISIKGEDILLTTPSNQLVKYHRLRATVPSRLWRWKVLSGWRWTGVKEHINSLELRAILTSVKWRVCHQRLVRKRFIHLTDSLVCLHCLSRGRSSSRKLRRTMCRINALLLASSCHSLWGYVNTDQNPADKPSRWGVRVRSKFRHA